MRMVMVRLPSAEAVQEFVETLAGLEGDFDLVSGRYILDARSLMGIFSLDLSQPVPLKIHKDSEETVRALGRFLAEENQESGEKHEQ